MERLRIEHETGYLEFDVEALFPLKRGKDKKVFELINKYCSVQTKMELFDWLSLKANEYNNDCEILRSHIKLYEPDSRTCKACKAELKRLETLYKKWVRNLELLEVKSEE